MQHQTPSTGRFVDLDELICRDCGDEVADGRDGFVHGDGSTLCADGAERVEVAR